MKTLRALLLATSISLAGFASTAFAAKEMLNVSYDPTRELYDDYNKIFIPHWKEKSGEDIAVLQSHGGSGKQARGVIDGLQADIVTLALAHDIDTIAEKAGLLPKDWQAKLPNNSSPYTSTILLMVRKGNPKHIKDWDDLIRDDVKVITPNPKTSGGARWNYLAAWGYAQEHFGNDEAKTKEFVAKLYKNVPVLDAGARGSTTTFAQRGIGDVLIAWENEVYLAINQMGSDMFEVVVPSISVLAEPPVAVVEKTAAKKGNEQVAQEYVKYLYSVPAQEIAAKHYYRPGNPEVLAKHAANFPSIKMLSIKDFGGWAEVQKTHFSDGGVFDSIYAR